MGAIKSILLVFLSLILIASLMSFGILWSIHTLLYPQIYENTFEKNNAYDLISNSSQFSQVVAFVKLPQGGIKSLVNMLLENTLSYLRGDSNQLNLTLQIDNNNLTNFFLNTINLLPVCNSGQQPFNGNIPICQPNNTNSSAFLNMILNKNNITINQTINLADVYGIKGEDINLVKSYIGIYQEILYGLGILSLVLIILIYFISDNKLRWTGINLFISGLLVYVLSFSAIFIPLNNLPQEIGFVNVIANDLIGNLIFRARIFSYIVASVGIVIFALSFFIKPKEKGKKSK